MPIALREPRLRLIDMREACARALSYVAGMRYDEFVTDIRTREAVERALFVLGEAAKNVPPDVRSLGPDLPWREMCGMRDVLGHGDFATKPDVIWDVVVNSLADVVRGLDALLGSPDLAPA